MYIKRKIELKVLKSLEINPVTAILGARQVGKTTLSKNILKNFPNSLYLDMEKPSEKALLSDAEQFFRIHNGKLICLDEIQLLPNIFPVIRSLVDDENFSLRFLITGSASPDLLRQSSESLAGRISYFELSPFLLSEIDTPNIERFWMRGGFPKSLFSLDDEQSMDWRRNFIVTFLERDLRNFGFNIPPETVNRLWKMLAHNNGQLLNYSQLSNSLGYSDTSIRKYIDILANTYMLRVLKPFSANLGKRMIKSPKIYIRDSGILNALQGIFSFDELYSHPLYGSSWEGVCIEQIISKFENWEPYFYRSSNGNELDLLLIKGNRKIAIEIKASNNPKLSAGFWIAKEELKIDEAFIIAPVKLAFPYKNDVWVYSLEEFLSKEI